MGRTEKDYRDDLHDLMKQTVADQAQIHNWFYRPVRPQALPRKYNKTQRVEADCSNGCRVLCRVVGVPDDPAGNHYESYGNSQSIWAHLDHADHLTDVEVGDIFTFGRYAGEKHACMAFDVTDKRNPVVWNLGTQGQPVFRTLQQEIDGHPGSIVTLCKIQLPPDPPATPQDKLQAMTGFYSWIAWLEGEGPWRKYGKKNPDVRPDVAKVISAVWWSRRARFLKNRNTANK